MTVAELIKKLEKMPQDIPVVICMCSTISDLEDDQPEVENMIKRHGEYVAYIEKWWDKAKDGEPNVIQVCSFPGN